MIGVIVYMSLSNSYCDNIVENELTKCEGALWANDSIESIILIVMIASSAWVYYCITQLDVNPSPISLLDDMLLFLCIPFFILYCALNLVSAAMFDPEEHAKGYLVPEITSTIMTNVLMVSEIQTWAGYLTMIDKAKWGNLRIFLQLKFSMKSIL